MKNLVALAPVLSAILGPALNTACILCFIAIVNNNYWQLCKLHISQKDVQAKDQLPLLKFQDGQSCKVKCVGLQKSVVRIHNHKADHLQLLLSPLPHPPEK